IKRRHPAELFQVYDLKSGRRLRIVRLDSDELAVRAATDVWFAGQTVPLALRFQASAVRRLQPRWRFLISPLGVERFRELAYDGAALAIPADAAGYQRFRVTTAADGSASDLGVESLVEIRKPDARGAAAVWTPANRVHFARGQALPVELQVRDRDQPPPRSVDLQLVAADGPLAHWSVALDSAGHGTFTVPGSTTALLRPGAYTLALALAERTCAPQPLWLGPGEAAPLAGTFRLTSHGDYQAVHPVGDLFAFPAALDTFLTRSNLLGRNFVIDRLGVGRFFALANLDPSDQQRLAAWATRAQDDPLATPSAKAAVLPPIQASAAGYDAQGLGLMAVLTNMDAGLPIGRQYDTRKPEQFAADILKPTKTLQDNPSFKGWVWTANWWVEREAPLQDPQRKAAYAAALKRAQDEGAWSPILEEVGRERINYAVEAQATFNQILDGVNPRL
ncbi:MAG: hypothetical protein IT480_19365, partial [Gammaproteobacteria bacterium]|nr:hypothetical protein [Gammaproteobacteria bacterium]